MHEIDKMFKLHYIAIVNRGLIKPETTSKDFLEKAKEELLEWEEAFNPDEAMDAICVLANWLIHNGHSIGDLLVRNIEYQRER